MSTCLNNINPLITLEFNHFLGRLGANEELFLRLIIILEVPSLGSSFPKMRT